MNSSNQVNLLTPIAPNVWSDGSDSPQLLGGRDSSGKVIFPIPDTEAGKNMEVVKLSRTGKLWSYTRQDFQPKPPYDGPKQFTPFLLGYIVLDEVIVESHIVDTTLEELSLDMEMELVIVPFDANRSIFAFKPARNAQ